LINYIKEFIPNRIFVFTCKKYYFLYHHLIKKHINDYENYVRETIRRDNYFVFKLIIEENIKKWIEVKHYKYKYALYVIVYYLCIKTQDLYSNNILLSLGALGYRYCFTRIVAFSYLAVFMGRYESRMIFPIYTTLMLISPIFILNS
jgi:hypothetical protein